MSLEGMPDGGVSASVDLGAVGAPAAESAQSAPPSFMESMPEEYRASKWAGEIGKTENPWHTLAKGYDNAQQQIGKLSSRIEVPGDEATPEQVQAYRKALGVPDNADAYGYNQPDLSKESEAVQKMWGDSADENFGKAMKAAAHELGLTPKQFEGIAQKFNDYNLGTVKSLAESMVQGQQQQAQAEMEGFRKVFGDKAESVRNQAKETLGKIGLPAEFQKSPDAALIFAMDFIQKNVFANDNIDGNPSAVGGQTKEELRSSIMKLRDDPAYKNKYPFERYNQISKQLDSMYRQESEASS